ncbi:MAG: PKD domain-containing protein [Planctomycetota bacterium]
MLRFSYLILLLPLIFATVPALAGGHLWDINELYSNSDGSIQFVELHVPMAACCENFMNNKYIRSTVTGAEFLFTGNLAGDTSFAHLLVATQGFANLPGAPTPDYILPDNFMALSGDTITWYTYDVWNYPTPDLPIDGVMSIQKNLATGQLFVGANTPTNYNGDTGSVDAGGPPPPPPAPTASFVSDVTGGESPLTVTFTDTSTGGIDTWSWSYGDGGSSTSASPTHTYNDAGLYTVTLTVTGAGGSDSFSCVDCISVTAPPPPPAQNFVRGDTNQDSAIDITDPIFLLGYLFSGTNTDCRQALDGNDDNAVDLGDAIYLLTFLFGNGPSPADPNPDCGEDLTPGGNLDCTAFNGCP